MTRGIERDESTPEATTVAALHNAFAQPLYRYAWSLVGGGDGTDDPAATAVHDALVAGTLLEGERAEPADLGPWLYALTRAACQRHGLTHICPYGRLATVPAEIPVAHMYSRLPASHRELVELTLRHALPTAAVARILSLDPRICGELARSAIRRAAEGLREAFGDEDEQPTWRAQLHEVSSALALLRPPGAPPGLRERAIRTCSDPALAAERERIASAMGPLTEEGYPVHRARTTATEEEGTPPFADPVDEQLPRALPADRITTSDHPVHEEYRADMDSPHGTVEDHHECTRRRRVLPAISGLLTVTLAVLLWIWSGSLGTPPTVIDAGPPESEHDPLDPALETTSTAVDSKPAARPSPESETDTPRQDPEASGGETPTDQGQDTPEDPNGPIGDRGTPGTEEETPPAQEPSTGEEEETPASPERPGGDEPPGDTDEVEGADGGRGLFGGLFGLLFGD